MAEEANQLTFCIETEHLDPGLVESRSGKLKDFHKIRDEEDPQKQIRCNCNIIHVAGFCPQNGL